jgi:hypothetical protein
MGSKFGAATRIAAGQKSRVSWKQLVAAGIDRHTIHRWVEDGRLHPVHHGVYAVGRPDGSRDRDYMAAVLACDGGSALSYRAAVYKLELLRIAPPPPEVTVPSTAGRSRKGIVIHRVRSLHPVDVADHDGIPTTTVPRTLLDMARLLAPSELARACHEAWVRHRTQPEWIEACIERNPTKHGAARLRAALGSDATLSRLEDGFIALLRTHGIPPPRTNVDVRGDKVDCHWPHNGLTVELLSYRFHASRQAFESDVARRRRSTHLAFTWGDAFERAQRTIEELRAAYARSQALA